MLVRPLSRAIARALSRPLSGSDSAGPVTKVLIDSSSTSNPFYSLSTPIVFAGDFEIEIDFLTTSTSPYFIMGPSANATSFIAIISGTIRVRTNNITLSTGVLTMTDGLLHTLKVTYLSGTVTIRLDGVIALSGAGADGTEIGVIGQVNSQLYFGGILSNARLRDLATPANTLEFELNQLTANTETNNGVTLTYQNIGTGTSVRDTYVLSNGGTQWISDLRTIDIAAQA